MVTPQFRFKGKIAQIRNFGKSICEILSDNTLNAGNAINVREQFGEISH